ncbi:FAD-dependent monooxygenase [Streptomyces montanisoli]|uniref:FAD-dependent monooxygenase n=1 Tax=Streptomyces montanisoli TaxID=2798581 RepID=A0A940MBJ0_9ACTN|nr:FAD-dependent monooxygenase [Streptomyces montanisoli]MBP0457937.1 FAD-dependent monooxygenase [Streptomyces montanisoli]
MELNNVKDVDVDVDVLVVGAGPAGLALACDLRRRGVDVLVAEKADALFPGSRGKGMQPRTLEVLDDLGVIRDVLTHGGPMPVPMMWRNGERLGERPMFAPVEPSEAEPYNLAWTIPQWRTQEILHARLVRLGGRVAFGEELTGLTQDGTSVAAVFASGRRVSARYAVAADGGRSTVRRLLGVAMRGEDVAPTPMVVADVRIPALDRDHWHTFAGEGEGAGADEGGHFLALCPLPGTADFQLAASLPPGSAPDLSPDGVRGLVAARTHLAASDVAEVAWSSDFRPRAALADRFRVGRVFLAGDAAHVHSPAGGQGLNTSVQDAYNLGWKLGQVLRAGAPDALLDTYEGERRPVAAGMLGLSTRIHRGQEQRGEKTRQLGLTYRTGPLASGAAGALAAGDRAPDGPLPDGTTIFDALRGPHFTLLRMATDAPLPDGLPAAVRVREQPAAYAPYGKGLFLVRPDGHIGWAGEDAGGLRPWLRSVGLA